MHRVKNGPRYDCGVSGNRPTLGSYFPVGDGLSRPLACAGLSEMNRSIIWTPELDDALRHFRAAGLSMLECSKRIGISHVPLLRRCRELDINIRTFRWTPGRDRQLRDLRAEGMSWTKVGRRLGVSHDVAHARGRKLGIDTARRTVWTPARIALLVRLRSEGYGWRRVSREIGLSSHACRERAARLGLYGSPAFAGSEVGHPPNTAARVAASMPDVSLPNLGGARFNEPGAPIFLGKAA
jgi:hypothetical protein